MSLGLVELSFPGKEDHPPNRVTFGERLYAKNVDPFARVKSWQQRSRMLWLFRLNRYDPAGSKKAGHPSSRANVLFLM